MDNVVNLNKIKNDYDKPYVFSISSKKNTPESALKKSDENEAIGDFLKQP